MFDIIYIYNVYMLALQNRNYYAKLQIKFVKSPIVDVKIQLFPNHLPTFPINLMQLHGFSVS